MATRIPLDVRQAKMINHQPKKQQDDTTTNYAMEYLVVLNRESLVEQVV